MRRYQTQDMPTNVNLAMVHQYADALVESVRVAVRRETEAQPFENHYQCAEHDASGVPVVIELSVRFYAGTSDAAPARAITVAQGEG